MNGYTSDWQRRRNVGDAPFGIVPSLTFYYPAHELRVLEERDRKSTVDTRIDSSRKYLVYQVIYHAMQEIIPRELEE